MEEIKLNPIRPEIGLVTLEDIEKVVKDIGRLDIRIVSRQRDYVLHRGIFFMLAVAYTHHTLSFIGNYLDKDHATVLHANKTTPWTLAQDQDAKNLFEAIHAAIRKILDDKIDTAEYVNENRTTSPTDFTNVYTRVDLLMLEIEELRTLIAKDKPVIYDTAE